MATPGGAFLVGDIVDFYNPGTATTTRTKIAESSATGEVKLVDISNEWLNASATTQHVKLIHRIAVGDKVDYFSQSSGAFIDATVTQIRQTTGATEFQINMKAGMWFTTLHQSIRTHSDQPVPPSPEAERQAKRVDTGTRVMEFDMTPKGSAVVLDPSLLLTSQTSTTVGLPVPPAFPSHLQRQDQSGQAPPDI